MARPAIDIEQLSASERFQLIEQLWESLRSGVEILPLSAEERAVVEQRRAAHHADPDSAVTWEGTRAELAADQETDEER